ncbi:hypothetical protein N9M14_02480 [Candidatus Pelagibacter bacterium]|nr:hypothetical protein [Candidatus Pelagibacter bacterium]
MALSKIDGTNFIEGTVPSTVAPGAGKVLQVINSKYGTLVTSSSSTWSDTGLTASITPSSASNKILVFANIAGLSKSDGSNTYMGLRLLRGASEIFSLATQSGYTNSTARDSMGGDGLNYLDSPGTTSSTTYKVQFRNTPATGEVTVNDGTALDGSTITLMEIAV